MNAPVPALPSIGGADASAYQARRRFWRRTAWACAFTWVALAVLLGVQTWRSALNLRVESLHSAVDFGAIALDANFSRDARAMESAVDREFSVSPDADPARWQRTVMAVKANVPSLADVSFVRVDGAVLASSSRRLDLEGPAQASVAYADFLKGVSRGQNLYLGRTYLFSPGDRWVIPVRLVVRDTSKRVIGTLVAQTAAADLAAIWGNVDMARLGVFGLIGDDGYLRARHSTLNQVQDAEAYSVPRDGSLIRHLRAHDFPQHGHVVGDTGAGRVRTLAVFHRLRNHPATFFAQVPITHVRQMWWSAYRQPLAVMALLGLAVSFGLWRVGRVERDWHAEQLRNAAAQATIHGLSNRLINAEEDERRRLALDLHDDLGQVLTAAKITLQSQLGATPAEAEALTQQSIGLVENALETVRNLSRELRPSVLDDLGLADAVRWLAQRVQSQGGLIVDVHGDFPERLPAEIEIHGYRVVHQALANIQRHAKARRVLIELATTPSALTIDIRDDGRGFDVEAALIRAREGGSLGLLGMQQRAQWMQGELTIASIAGTGTHVRLVLPLAVATVTQAA